MPSVKGVKCSLVVAEHPVEEYGAIVEDNFVSTYVIATVHEHFHISVVVTEFVHENLEIYVYIDGKYQTSSIFERLAPNRPANREYHGKTNWDDMGTLFKRPWRFDELIEGSLCYARFPLHTR